MCIDQRIGEINDECLRGDELKRGRKRRILAIT
jgi:hypothetical protein